MSAGNDHLFARWSRRKKAVRSSENQIPDEEKDTSGIAADDAELASIDQPPVSAAPEATDTEAAEPAQPLPRIEDLTAESDFSAFLRKGVPKALKNAAIRRMWSLDPGIRDHVGLAENAWDFNKPGSMAGFGPLDAKDAVVDFLSTVGRATEAISKDIDAVSEAAPAQPSRQLADSSGRPADTWPDATGDAASDGLPEAQPDPASSPSPAPERFEPAVGQAETVRPAPSSQPAARPRHGGALPR